MIMLKEPQNVVKKMIEALSNRFFGSNRIIGMDNYFTSFPLAKYLFQNKLGLKSED